MTTWGDIYHRHVNRGEDPGYAAWMADKYTHTPVVVHMRMVDNESRGVTATACGLYVHVDRTTRNPLHVTCGRCKRSTAMKNIRPQP